MIGRTGTRFGLPKAIPFGLDGTIQFQIGDDAIECVIQYIAEACTDVIAILPALSAPAQNDVMLSINPPVVKSPIRFAGRILYCSESEELLEGLRGYLARVSIDQMSRIDRRRLELLIARREAFINWGHGYRSKEETIPTTAARTAERLDRSEQSVGMAAEDEDKDSVALLSEIEFLKKRVAQLENIYKQGVGSTKETYKSGKYNILIVDYELANLNALRRTFRREYNILSATNGEDALTIMERNGIALIITDHRLPGMTGLDFLKRVSEKYPDTISIVLTADTDEELLMDAINTELVRSYIIKPWEPEEMKTIVREAIHDYKKAV